MSAPKGSMPTKAAAQIAIARARIASEAHDCTTTVESPMNKTPPNPPTTARASDSGTLEDAHRRDRERREEEAGKHRLALVRPPREREESTPSPAPSRGRCRRSVPERAAAAWSWNSHDGRDHEGDGRRAEQAGQDQQEHQRGDAALAEHVAEPVPSSPAARCSPCRDHSRARQQRERHEHSDEADGVRSEDPGRPARRRAGSRRSPVRRSARPGARGC